MVLAIQFVFSVYGGYFGAGLGVLLMAALTLIGVSDVQSANAQKNFLATVITTISVGIFIAAGVVAWPATLAVLVGATIGGYFGARLARAHPRQGAAAVHRRLRLLPLGLLLLQVGGSAPAKAPQRRSVTPP